MRIAEYMQWTVITFFSLLIVKAVYPREWPPIEKFVFSALIALAFFFLVGGFWLSTGKKFDERLYEMVLCPLFNFAHCEPPRPLTPEEEARRRQQEEQQKKAEAERGERERQEQAQRQQRQEQLRRQDEIRRQDEARRQEEARRQDETRRQEEARRQGETRRQEEARKQEEARRRSMRFAATAVGHTGHRWYAATARDEANSAEAETKARARCNQVVQECRIVARFNGAGKCVYAAGGSIFVQQFGRPRKRSGVRVGPTEAEAIQKCQAAFRNCRVFHVSCNSG